MNVYVVYYKGGPCIRGPCIEGPCIGGPCNEGGVGLSCFKPVRDFLNKICSSGVPADGVPAMRVPVTRVPVARVPATGVPSARYANFSILSLVPEAGVSV